MIKTTYRFLFCLLSFLVLLPPIANADEGMWLPLFLRDKIYGEMAEMGLELTPEQIYSVNNSSLKDAVVAFGGFCTAEVISDQGLLLTNHHCGYDAVRSVSTPEKDYLTDGFWAMEKGEEKPIEGLYVSFLVRIEDVTDKVLEGIDKTTPEDKRQEQVATKTQEITVQATDGNGYTAEVKPFYEGNKYFLFVYENYSDIRLVGAPPEAIGKFGGDTDNWMWPRHTGDFSMFRIYADKNNKPAEYSEDNVPYKPKHHLPISLKGVKEGDFSMIMGYPGGTQRYLSSYGVDLAINVTNPTRVKLRRARLDILDETMAADKAVRLDYASKYARISNYWKYFIGQTRGLKALNVLEQKQDLENEFQEWANADAERKEIYGDAINMIKQAYEKADDYALAVTYFGECQIAPEILLLPIRLQQMKETLSKFEGEQEKWNGVKAQFEGVAEEHFENYHMHTDKRIFATMMQMYSENVPKDQQTPYFKELVGKYKNDFEKMADKTFDRSFFASMEEFKGFLAKPSVKKLEKDPAWELSMAFLNHYRNDINTPYRAAMNELTRGQRLFIDGLMQMYPERDFYSDANFTMRLTYGKVLSYEPRDAVYYNYYTTAEGILQKSDPTDREFMLPPSLEEKLEKREYGQYAEDGTMYVGFITNHDITGGNSGSPVINGKGELIGCAFDGNWEAMSGDIAFEPELQRTISVDIRYILWVVEEYAGAGHLVEEMTIVK